MGEIKTNWTDPVMPDFTDMGGDLPTARGTDPLIDTGGSSGLQAAWANSPVPTPGGDETANSLSGLPLQPQRFQPSETPPAPPSLKDRSPGTIDG